MNRTPFLLSAIVFAAVAALSYFLLRERMEDTEAAYFELARLSPDTLTVAYPPDTTVLVPGGTGWRLIHPVRDRADEIAVEALLKRLRDLRAGRRFPLVPEKLDTYGFRYPQAMIRAAYADRHPPDTLWIGGFTMDAGRHYVRAGSSPEVALVESRTVKTYLLKDTVALRYTQLIPFHEARAEALVIRDRGGTIVTRVEKRGDGWWITHPYPGPADDRRVLNYLASLSHMQVTEFLRETVEDWTPFGLVPPRVSVAVATSTGDTVLTYLGDRAGDLAYARDPRREALLGVAANYPAVLLRGSDPLREPLLQPFGIRDVDSLRVETPGKPPVVWTSEAWSGVDRESPLGSVLEHWFGAKAEAFAPADPSRLGSLGFPAGRLVWWGEGDTLMVVERGRAADGRIPVRSVSGRGSRPGEILFFSVEPAGVLWDFLARGDGGS